MSMLSRGTVLRSITLALALGALTASGARAQGYQTGPVWEITAFNGYYIASDLYTSTGTTGGVQVGLDNSYMWGGRLGVTPNPRLGVEFVYTRTGSDLKLEQGLPSGFPAIGELGRINGNSYDLDFLFLQPTGNPRATGYFTLGFGWTITDPDIQVSGGTATPKGDSNSLFAWNFGVGAKVDMNEKIALRLEGRWRVTDTGITTSSGVYCDAWGYCYGYASDWYNSGELTAGLTFKLGGRR
jgi:opacity protein-like surface antigen